MIVNVQKALDLKLLNKIIIQIVLHSLEPAEQSIDLDRNFFHSPLNFMNGFSIL